MCMKCMHDNYVKIKENVECTLETREQVLHLSLISCNGGRSIKDIFNFGYYSQTNCCNTVSTVKVKKESSISGNVLDPAFFSLSPNSIQVYACLDDWTRAQYRQ